jgi:arginine deiminase
MSPARRGEEIVVREALANLGVPILHEFTEPSDMFEGFLVYSPETAFVAETERHSRATIEKFIGEARRFFREIIFVEAPRARRFKHADTIFNRIDRDLAMAYLPAFKSTHVFSARGAERVDFVEYMRRRGVDLIEVSDAEQLRDACTFVPLQPGVIFHHDNALEKTTQAALARRGVELIPFHFEALAAGGGSLRCQTLRLRREPMD